MPRSALRERLLLVERTIYLPDRTPEASEQPRSSSEWYLPVILASSASLRWTGTSLSPEKYTSPGMSSEQRIVPFTFSKVMMLLPSLSDHFKSGQRLSLQNRPTKAIRNLKCFTLPLAAQANPGV